jgi:hypothetical protein
LVPKGAKMSIFFNGMRSAAAWLRGKAKGVFNGAYARFCGQLRPHLGGVFNPSLITLILRMAIAQLAVLTVATLLRRHGVPEEFASWLEQVWTWMAWVWLAVDWLLRSRLVPGIG